jgi:hypothetical protein
LTAICGGGPSGPQPGVEANISFNGTSVAAGAVILGLSTELAAIIAVTVAGTVLGVNAFCAGDPPPDPGITDQDFADVKNPLNPAAFATAAGRLKDWYLNQYWHSVCECTGATTPPPPAPSLPVPVGTNTGLPTGTLQGPCWNTSWNGNAAKIVSGAEVYTDISPQVLPHNATHPNNSGSFPGVSTVVALPTGVHQVAATFSLPNGQPAGVQADVYVAFLNSTATTVLGSGHIQLLGGAPNINTFPVVTVPTGSIYWLAAVTTSDSVNDEAVDVGISFYCANNDPNGLSAACCPPDPMVQEYLQLIVNLLSKQYTAPAAAAPPTSWSDGIRHSALAGAGTITINAKAIGVRLEVTTPPAGVIIQPGSPNFYWDMGFITPIALTSPLRGQRLVFLKESFALPEFTDQVGYTLLHGTVADAIELLPV